jgi:hypothetical protein
MYLNNQEDNYKSVDLVTECLNYILSLHKNIEENNVSIAMQSFSSLTEFIQGPCVVNQKLLSSTKFFFMANEILCNEYNENELNFLNQLKLKKLLMITLVSMIAENKNQEIVELMISSLKVENILKNLLFLLPSNENSSSFNYFSFFNNNINYNNNNLLNNGKFLLLIIIIKKKKKKKKK